MSEEKHDWDSIPEDDPFWEDLEARNTGEFWKIEEGEHEKSSAVENLLETVTMPKVPERRVHRHRARRARSQRRWFSVGTGALVITIVAGIALASQPPATPLGGKTSADPIETVTLTPKPTPVPGPPVTRWRTREVKVPGPTVTLTQTPEPTVVRTTRYITVEPDVFVPPPPPTVTVTVTKTREIVDDSPFE